MRMKVAFVVACIAAALGAGPALAQSGVVTVYSADGLRTGSPNWYQTQFDAFTKATGVQDPVYRGAVPAVVVDRVSKEKSNPQADVLVTLPPFIQKAAADGLLQSSTPAGADQIAAADRDPQGRFVPLVNNYARLHLQRRGAAAGAGELSRICSIRNTRTRSSTRRPAKPATARP